MNFILDEENNSDEIFQESKQPRIGLIAKLCSLALVVTLGGTYAADIRIGTGSSQEFGQGVQITSSCDSEINIVPVAKFRNDVLVPGNYVESFNISNVSDKCRDKLFVLRAYPESGEALSGNSSEPFRTFKFHFHQYGWSRDDMGCISFQGATVGSQESNSARIDLTSCIDSNNRVGMGSNNQPPMRANDVYKFTLESRPYTVAQIDLLATDTSTNLGWAYKTGESDFISWMTNTVSFPLYPDLALGDQFMVFAKISTSDFNNSARNSNIYSLTQSSNVICRYSGKYQASAQITEAPFIGLNGPGMYSWVAYVCKATGAGSITFS